MHLENLVCFTAYGPPISPLLVRPSWDVVVATPAEGWTIAIPPTAVEFWLPAGSYTVEEGKFASELNTDPLYLPDVAWWTRPAQTINITPGAILVFGDKVEGVPDEVPPPSETGYVRRPNTCALKWSPLAAAVATPTTESTPAGTPSHTGEEEEFFNVSNGGGVNNGATEPTTFTIDGSWLVTTIVTYHWNNASGATPGTIGLKAADGTTYGPWQAAGQPGQGGVPDAYWAATPNVVIPPGTYTVLDSDPSTWAQNDETGGAGMSWASGIRQ
jgi:hypothetical protein